MKQKDEAFLLDTSALFAFTDNEEGAGAVQELLERARKGAARVAISSMSFMEMYCITCQEIDAETALELLAMARSLPVEELPLTYDLIVPAGDFKARYQISMADAWIAATAKIHGLTLLHKDPEFEPLKDELSITELPYKKRR